MDCKDISVTYGMYNLCVEREQARWSLGYIMEDFADIKKRYISLGFHLAEFKRCEYYKDFGYITFAEFCEKNIPLDKGSISRCLQVFEVFAARDGIGSSRKMWLDDKYKNYSYSQLVEMAPMDSTVRALITPDMSVVKIREVKKFCKDKKIKSYDSCDVGSVKKFIDDGCVSVAPVKVATSQPVPVEEEDEDDNIPLYSSEQLGDEEFLNQFFSRVKAVLEFLSLDVCDIEWKGKQLTFKDLNGDSYSVLYRVIKNK